MPSGQTGRIWILIMAKNQTDNNDTEIIKDFEISYIITGTVKDTIKATDIDDAITKASLATRISKIISGFTGMNVDSVSIEKITDDQNITYFINDDQDT